MRTINHTVQRWYGALLMPDGRVQCVTAHTLPRNDENGKPESPYDIATDPARAEWPQLR